MTQPNEQKALHEPRGTLIIVSVFGALVVFGWLALFFGLFVPRGTH